MNWAKNDSVRAIFVEEVKILGKLGLSRAKLSTAIFYAAYLNQLIRSCLGGGGGGN